jgi:hypothetical protein
MGDDMAYLPQFKNDLFISYRRAANEAHDNWVDAFCEALRASLAELVGDVSIWRDEELLRAGAAWRPEIAEALNNAAIFLAIISRTYLDSDECRKELDIFLGRLKDPQSGTQRMIMPIFKQPPKPGQELPREVGEVHRHEFFRWDPPGSPRFRELGPDPDGADTRAFWETLGRVAQDIMVALEALHGKVQAEALGTVFLARVGPEIQLERERLRSDLQQRHYLVVPEHEYLWNADDFRDRIERDLDAAQLCIHLVSRNESIEPETAARAQLQLQLANEAMRRNGRPPPLVWIQPASAVHPSARALIDYIEGDLANDGVEYWRGGLEDLKTQVYDKLAPAAPAPAAAAGKVREVALLVEEGDLGSVGSLRALLVDRLGIDPQPVKFAGAAPRDAARMNRTLAACDQCLLVWAAQPEDWVHDVLDNEAFASRLGRDRMCVVALAPPTPEKATFQTTKARTIQAVASLDEAGLRAFLAGGANDG